MSLKISLIKLFYLSYNGYSFILLLIRSKFRGNEVIKLIAD